jgi:hypothetical protein
MDVTIENFETVLPIFEESVANCDFVAFDTEFSGLNLCGDERLNDYDSNEERYQKLKYICTKLNSF